MTQGSGLTSLATALIAISCILFMTAASAERLLICIDGTKNDPNDAIEEYDKTGLLEDNDISNVLKLHILAGGSLDNKAATPDQHSFYYVGVGNRSTTALGNAASAALAIFEPREILGEAYRDLAQQYKEGDSIFIFGFSRGAAIARQLAQKINDQGLVLDKTTIARDVEITMLGVWDTVAAYKGVNLDLDENPSTTEVNETNGRIADNIRVAYHLVSVDDPRLAFRPVLMGAEERVHEIWFPGVHSDVGGGYKEDGLSDITLRFMMDKAKGEGVTFLSSDKIDYDRLAPITSQNIELSPDVLGRLHLATVIDDKAYVAWLQRANLKDIMAPRKIYVAVDDQASQRPPLIHHSVLERREASSRYNPPNLAELNGNFRILLADGSIGEP
jgi:uncharacterized protein (DUF2235 family)